MCTPLPPSHTHTQECSHSSRARARLLWRKIRAGIINHESLPLVKSGLSWCEWSAVPAEQRQATRWLPAAGATSGARHDVRRCINLAADGRTVIGTRWRISQSPPVHPPWWNEKQLELWRSTLFEPHLLSAKKLSTSEGEPGSLPRRLGRESYGSSMITVTLGRLWKYRKMLGAQSQQAESCTSDLEIQLWSMFKTGLNHWKSDDKPRKSPPECFCKFNPEQHWATKASLSPVVRRSSTDTDELKCSHVISMLPVPPFVKVNYFIGCGKKEIWGCNHVWAAGFGEMRKLKCSSQV